MRAPRAVAIPLALSLLLPASLPGQQKPRTGAPALPVFGVETRVIALPVFVTDKSGKAVPGLVAADFEVEDGGKSAEVVAFDAVDASVPVPDLSTESTAVQAATRRQFLLLFDMAFSTPSGLNKARAAALDFLGKGLGPSDLAAVAVLGAAGSSVLVGFTSDVPQLRQAVANLGAARGARLRDPLGLAWDLGISAEDTPGGLHFTGGDEDRDAVFQLQRSEQEAYRRTVATYVDSLESLGRLLDSVQGRKQVVLFSAGFDQGVLSGSQGSERAESARAVSEGRLWEVQGDSYFGDSSARSGLDQLFRRFGASDAVIHTVDLGGMAAGGDITEATRTQGARGRDTLAHLASGSGGIFLKEVNDVAGALRDVMDASRYFYVLGFAPPEEGKPGRFRKLSVKVKRPGLKASCRAGYLVPDPKAATDTTMAQLSAGDVIAKGLSGGAFPLEALAVPVRDAQGTAQLPVVLHLDGPGLLAGVKEATLGLEIYGYVMDAQGRIKDALSTTPSLDLTKLRASLQADGLQVLTVFKAPEGTADLRFLVRHAKSGRTASLRVLVPPESKTAWPVSAPLVMSDPSTRLVVPVASRANPELDLPFRVGTRPFSPEVGPVLKNGAASEVCVMARPPRGPSLEVMVDLRAADGTSTALETTGPVRLVKDRDGAFRIVLSLTPKAMEAGDYALRVTLRDEAGDEVHSEQPVAVR